jgi:hypothetical protein
MLRMAVMSVVFARKSRSLLASNPLEARSGRTTIVCEVLEDVKAPMFVYRIYTWLDNKQKVATRTEYWKMIDILMENRYIGG